MTIFQSITLPLLGLLGVRSLLRVVRSNRSPIAAVCGALVSLAAVTAILRPQLTSTVAAALGIGRGADLVLYVFCICFLIGVFYAYGKLQQIDSALTEIVRYLALRAALDQRPEDGSETMQSAVPDHVLLLCGRGGLREKIT